MHETVLKTVTVGVVAGLLVYWLTSKHIADNSGRTAHPVSYTPLLGDIRCVPYGNGTQADCQCCGLPSPQNTVVPLATDYLCSYPEYAPPTSKWNLGVSLQVTCQGLDANIYRTETATSFPHGVAGPKSTPPSVRISNAPVCDPEVCLQVDCTEII